MKSSMYHALARPFTFILTLIMLSLSTPYTICADYESENGMAKLADKGMLNFAVAEGQGSDVDKLLYAIFSRMHYDVSVTGMGMAAGMVAASTGQYDGLSYYREGLEEEYPSLVMIPEPVKEISYTAYIKKGSEVNANNWQSITSYRVGYQYQNEFIPKSLPTETKRINRYQTNRELAEALENNKIDIAVVPVDSINEYLFFEDFEALAVLEKVPAYIYLNQMHRSIVPQATALLQEMKADGTFEQILETKKATKDSERKSFLFLTSYGSDRADYRELEAALKEVILENPKNDILTFNINPALLPSTQVQKAETTNYLRTQFVSGNPDVIIASHNAALEYLEDTYFSMFGETAAVYCSVNDIEDKNAKKFEPYFTGNVESLAAKETVEGIMKLFPETKGIFVINDFSAAGVAAKNDIMKDLEGVSGKELSITYNYRQSCADLMETLRLLPENTALLVGEYYEDDNGEFYDEALFVELLREATDAPIFGLKGRDAGFGQIGGRYSDPAQIGAEAAQMAVKLAEGATIQQVSPVESTLQYSRWILDYEQLGKYGLENSPAISELNATVINKPLTFKDTNPMAFRLGVGFVGVLSALLAVLFVMLTKLSKKNAALTESQKSLHTAEEMLDKEEQLRKTKERTAQIIDTAPLVYVNTAEDVVIDSNRYAKENLGLYPGDDIKKIYSDKDERKLAIEALGGNPTLIGEVLHFQTIQQEVNRFMVNVAVADWDEEAYGLFLWGINIEKSEQQKDSIERAQEDMQNLIEALPMPLFILDPDTATIAYGNRAHAQFIGAKDAASVLGMSIYDFFPETVRDGKPTRELIPEYIRQVMELKIPVAEEFEHLTLDGRLVDSKVTGTNIVYKGQDALIVIMQDITAEKEKNTLLQSIAEREKEANELKGKFIVNMSHEIRTPMNAIIGLSGIEISKTKDRETFNAFQKINSSAKNLLSIVNEILDFSKIEDDSLDLQMEEFVVEDVVAEVLQVMMQRLDSKDVEIIADISPELPTKLIGDKNRITQILKNIMDNAVKFTNIGFIALMVRKKDMAAHKRIVIDFEVLDTGIGMKEHQVDRMFIPFEQFSSNSGKNDGTGLGMSVTKQLVDLMQGDIGVKSQYGVGTWVGAAIPFDEVPDAPLIKEVYAQPYFAGKTILIVDDSQICCDMMSLFLSSLDFVPTCVPTAADALKIILDEEQAGRHYDLIILDYILPDENGLVLAQKIHERTASEQKLLLMSAFTHRIMPAEIEGAGFAGTVSKPFVPAALIERLVHALNVDLGEDDWVTEAQYPNAKVLVAEDNMINQEVAIGMLEIFGIEPVIADNGQEAINCLEESEYDLVLMDILMPELNGHDATVKIRSSGRPYSNIPIVAMTANAMQEEIDKCLAEGMNGHVAKPIELDQLARALAQWLPKETRQMPEDAPEKEIKEEEGSAPDLLYIDGIDTEDGARRFANKMDRYQKALLSFARDIDPSLEELTGYINEADYVHARQVAHKMKGVAGNLGAKKMYSAAADFENVLAEGKTDAYLFSKLRNTAKSVMENIVAAFKAEDSETETAAIATGTRNEALMLLTALKTALEEYDPTRAEEIANDLLGKRWESIDQEALEETQRLIEDYMFDEALEKIYVLTEGESPNV